MDEYFNSLDIYSNPKNGVTEDNCCSIIENRITSSNHLTNLKISEFTNEVSSDSPAPGGGSVSALSGSLSASLIAMVSNLTFGTRYLLILYFNVSIISGFSYVYIIHNLLLPQKIVQSTFHIF